VPETPHDTCYSSQSCETVADRVVCICLYVYVCVLSCLNSRTTGSLHCDMVAVLVSQSFMVLVSFIALDNEVTGKYSLDFDSNASFDNPNGAGDIGISVEIQY
jgi:hypothetical protein